MNNRQGWLKIIFPVSFFLVVISLVAIGWSGYINLNHQSKSKSLDVSGSTTGSADTQKTDLARLSEDDVLKKVGGSLIRQDGNVKSTELSKLLDFHLADTTTLLEKLDNAEQDEVGHINNLLESKKAELLTIEEEVSNWLSDHNLGESDLKNKLSSRFLSINKSLESVISAPTVEERQQAIASTRDLLSKLMPSKVNVRGQSAPGFSLDRPAQRKPRDYPTGLPPAYDRNHENPLSVLIPQINTGLTNRLGDKVVDGLLASIGISNAYAAAPPISSEAQSCASYTTADISSALPEVDITDPDIMALAEDLGYSAIKIYSYVKNNIKFVPYLGSVKGALGTLKSGSGNALDQASLLVALFRASNIPSRYITGQIVVSDENQMLNWLGTKTVYSARDRVIQGYIAGELDINDDLSFVHMWVQACVPYDNYRGSNHSSNSGHHWIPLDPSFKEMEYTDGTTVSDIQPFSFNFDTYLNQRSTTMPHEALQDQMEQTFGGALTHGGGYKGSILQKEFDILPSTLPYAVDRYIGWNGAGTASDVVVIPEAYRVKATINLTNITGQPLFASPVVIDFPELANKRLTLSFLGATASDQTNIDTWLDTQGAETPCSTTNVKPIMRLDGVDISASSSQSVGLCSIDNKLDISVTIDEGALTLNSTIFDDIGGHNYHSLMISAFQSSDQLIEERASKLLEAVGSTPDPNDLHEETLGEYLNIIGLRYFNYIDNGSRIIGEVYGETSDAGHHIGSVSTAMKVSYLFDLPFAVSGEGLLIDVPGAKFRQTDINNSNSTGPEADFEAFKLRALMASAYESYVWQEHAQMDAISTTRGLQFANENSLAVVELLSATDVDSMLNLSCPVTPINLNYSEGVKNDLRGLLNSGYNKVSLPSCLISYQNWTGAVWLAEYNQIVNNMPTYNIAATISGDYVAEGGYTVGNGPIGYGYDPALNTGIYGPPLPSFTSISLFGDQGTSSSVDIFRFDPGFGAFTGFNNGFTTLAGDPVNLVSGNMYHPERDIHLKGRGGLDIAFERTYNSNMRKDGPLGYGWTHSFNHYLVFMDDSGDGQTSQAVWMNGSGATNTFSVAGLATGVPVGTSFTSFSEELEVTVQREANGEYSIQEKSGLTFYFENIAGLPDEIAKLIRVTDRNGNSTHFAYGGENLSTVTDDLNRTLTFYYDDVDHHITRVEDWSGRTYRYTYANNNLTSFETPRAIAGQETATTYDYYAAADGTNLDRAMKSFTHPNGDSMTFEYYTNGKVFRHIDSLGQTHTFRYNRFRRETTAIDEKGISQTYLFNEYGQQVQHIQGDGSRRIYEYNDPNNPRLETVVRQELGYETLHEYDVDGNLIKTTQPDGSFIAYSGFNTLDQHCTVKDTNNNYSLKRYDANGQITDTIALNAGVVPATIDCSYVPASGDIKSWVINEYDSYGNLTRNKTVRNFTTQAGPYVEYIYDAAGLNPVTVKRCGLQQDASGTVVDRCVSATQTFDALGRLTQKVNGNFYTSAVEYNENGAVSRSTDETNQWRGYDYDDNGNLTAEHLIALDATGKTVFYSHNTAEYDSLNRPVNKRNIAGHRTKTIYDEIGNVLKVTNPDGYSVYFEYDGLSRPIRAYDEHGRAVHTQYDIGGRPISITDPNGNTSYSDYYGAAENGQLRLTTSPDNRTLEYFYDNSGNVIRTVDNIGRENLTEYDSLNRPVRKVGPIHNSYGLNSIRQVTVTTYTALGFVEKIEAGYTANASGAVGADVLAVQASYAYDDFGRLLTETDANGMATSNVYDDHGNLVSTQKANGHIVTLDYDHARNGVMTTKTAKLNGSDPSPHITSYQYNPLGQLILVTAPEVSYTYGYDEAQRLDSVTDSRGNKTLNYDFSPGGQLNSIADSENKRSDFLYDAASRLTAILAPNGERVNFFFDAGGRLRETSMANGVSAKYSYDAGNKLQVLTNATSQGQISQHQYGYDNVGRRTSHIENIVGTTTSYNYNYDNLDRMTSVYQNAGATLVEAYAYDQFNNRRTRQPNGSSAYHYLYDSAQQLNEIRNGSDTGTVVASFGYDDSGNMVNKDEGGVTRALTYDAQERLVQVSGSNINTETYAYDHEGRRIEKTSGGTTNRYIYSGPSIWSEYNFSWSAALAHYTYTGLDKRVIRSAASDASYYHNDGLGSVVAVSNASGATQSSTRFDAWGSVIASTGSTQFGFTGREMDATGLGYFRARHYDSTMGRFTQRDPIGFGGGLNPYTYVSNSPQNFTDPLGLLQAPVDEWDGWVSSYAGSSSWDSYFERTPPAFPSSGTRSRTYYGGTGPSNILADASGWVGNSRNASYVSNTPNWLETFNSSLGLSSSCSCPTDFIDGIETFTPWVDYLGKGPALIRGALLSGLRGIDYIENGVDMRSTEGESVDVWGAIRGGLDAVGDWWAPPQNFQAGHDFGGSN
ncbi:RHS repeat-associated core domain-containing protein [Pseudomonadota bacterium]